MKPRFATLIILTLVTAALLLPFAFSAGYLDALRNRSVNLHQVLRGELYKQTTGYLSLAFVGLEMALTVRKRSLGWTFKIRIPGSMQFWRSLHIFTGVGLVALTLVHTLGSTGANFNSVFLWVFWGVTLSALLGAVAETGILASPRKYFGLASPKVGNLTLGTTKGPLIRGLRAFWLSTHIILVTVFSLMLGVHIFLAYYYQ